MDIIQVAFEVPSWVEVGIKNGTLKIFGGVVRNLKGEIVYHLKDVGKVIEKANAKTKLIVAGVAFIGTIVVVTGAYAANKMMNKKNSFTKAINQFNQRFFEYIIAAKNTKMNMEIINKLDDSIELLKNEFSNSNKNLNLEGIMDSHQFNELIDSVYRYTLDLIEKNMVDSREIGRSNQEELESSIIDLQNYLKLQRKVFAKCA